MGAEDDVEAQMALLIAASEAEDLAAYVAKGRPLQNLSVEDLAASYVFAFRAWAASDGSDSTRPALDDASAEYQLRRLDPPNHLLDDERKQLGIAMAKRIRNLGVDGLEVMEENIQRRLNDIEGAKN